MVEGGSEIPKCSLRGGCTLLGEVGEMEYPGYSGFVRFSRAGCKRKRSLIFVYSGYGGRFDVHVKGSGLGTTGHGRRMVSRGRNVRSFNGVLTIRGMFTCGRMLPLRRKSGLVNHQYGNGSVSVPVRDGSPDLSHQRYCVGIGGGGRKGVVCALHSGSDVAKAFLVGRVLKPGSRVHVRSKTVVALKTAALVLETTRKRARRWATRKLCGFEVAGGWRAFLFQL